MGYSLREVIDELRRELLEKELQKEKKELKSDILSDEEVEAELEEMGIEDERFKKYLPRNYIRKKEKQFESILDIIGYSKEDFKNSSGHYSFSEKQKKFFKDHLLKGDRDISLGKINRIDEEIVNTYAEIERVSRILKSNPDDYEAKGKYEELNNKINNKEKRKMKILSKREQVKLNYNDALLEQSKNDNEKLVDKLDTFYFMVHSIMDLELDILKNKICNQIDEIKKAKREKNIIETKNIIDDYIDKTESKMDEINKMFKMELELTPSKEGNLNEKTEEELRELARKILKRN